MIDPAEALPSTSVFGRLVRLPLKIIPSGTIVPVLSGPLRGARWVVGSGLHGYWLGTYESEKQRIVAGEIRQGQVVYDIGANIGFYTLLAARLTGSAGAVYAFEPSPENVERLRRHLVVNACSNVTVIPCAVAETPGTARFQDDTSCGGKLLSDGRLTVQVEALDPLIEAGRIRPADVVKIDVEGAEASVLRGGAGFIRSRRPVIVLATHGRNVHDECCELLRDWGYSVVAIRPFDSGSGLGEVIAR